MELEKYVRTKIHGACIFQTLGAFSDFDCFHGASVQYVSLHELLLELQIFKHGRHLVCIFTYLCAYTIMYTYTYVYTKIFNVHTYCQNVHPVEDSKYLNYYETWKKRIK